MPDRDYFTPPTRCPVCFTPLVRDGAYLICPNTATCSAQVSGAVKRWVSKLGIKFFGETLIDALCDQGHVSTIADLYRLDPAEVSKLEMNGRKVGGSADRGFASLRANMELPLHVFVGSLGIPLIGRSMAKTIVDAGYDTLEKMRNAGGDETAAIPGMGAKKAVSFVIELERRDKSGVIDDLLSVGITIKAPAEGAFKGKSVCMSGFRDADMVAAIEGQGGTVKSGVSKTLGALVLKNPASTSGKAKKARQYGVEVIGIDEMWSRLGGRP